jgi:ribosomal protein S18 acetylase RimI-like enzyme
MYTLRQARPEDVRAAQEIDLLFVKTPNPAKALRKATDEGKMLVAESAAGEVVAYVRWDYFWDTIPLCITLNVKPEHQRRGLGRRLMQHIETDFRDKGSAFWLSSTEETNENSQRFHERCGFRRIGALADLGQDVREIFYRKDIS